MSAESTPTQAKHRSIMPELGRHSFIYTVGNLLTRSVGFVMLPLYTRFLTPQEFGVVELTELTVSVVTLLVGVGAVGGAMNRIYHEYKRGPERDAVVSTSMWSALCLSFIIFLAGTLSAPLVARQLIHDGSLAGFVALSFVAVVASTQIEVALVYVRLQERSRFFVAFSVVYTLAQMLGNVFFIVYGGLGMWGLLYSKLLVGVSAAVLLSVLNIRSVGWAWSRSAFDRLWHFGRPLVATSVAFFIIHFADRWFIAAYATTTDVGLYAVGYKFGFLITFLVGEPFGRIWNAKVFAYASRPNWKEEFARVFTFFFAALAGAWVVLAGLSRPIIAFAAGPSFQGAAIVIPYVALGYVLRETGDFWRQLLYIDKRTTLVRNIAIASAIVNLTLDWTLIPRFGSFGAGIATLATWGAYSVMCYVASQKYYRVPYQLSPMISLGILLGALTGLAFDMGHLAEVAPNIATLAICLGVLAFLLILVWRALQPHSSTDLDGANPARSSVGVVP